MGRPTTKELKHQLIADLARARGELTTQAQEARLHLAPKALAMRSLQQHKVAWTVGGVVAGILIVRLMLPPKIRSDKWVQSDKKRPVSGGFGAVAYTMVRRAAMNYATKHFKDQAQHYLQSLLKRQDRDPNSHV
jgi:hypothetical protein